jgi:hypothetical protein
MGLGYGEYIISEDFLMSSEEKNRQAFPSVEKAKEKFLEQAMPCPLCKTPPEQLSWVYMVIPQWACKDAEQHEGWVTICDLCKIQIDFFSEKDK